MTRQPPRARTPLHLLTLEDRTVPATFTATSFQDLDTTGVDLATGKLPTGEVTLRSAILAANATTGADTIVAPAGTYVISIAGAEEDGGVTGDLDITDSATLELTGASLDASSLGDRILHIVNSTAVVSINGGTFTGGNHVGSSLNQSGCGGAILNNGDLTLNAVVIANNKATGMDGDIIDFTFPGDGLGGGIASSGNLTIIGGEISNNQAFGGANPNSGFRGGNALGGGVYQSGGGSLTLISVRVSGNSATGGTATGSGEGNQAGSGLGGGVFVENTSTVIVSGVRVDNNQAKGGEGFNFADGGTGEGGGLYIDAFSSNIVNSTIDTNAVMGGNGSGDSSIPGGTGGDAIGGGIEILISGQSTSFINNTISGNRAVGGDGTGASNSFGGNAIAGGIYIGEFFSSSGGSFIGNVTITDNEVQGGNGSNIIGSEFGGGIGYENSGNATLGVLSTLVAGNRAANDPDISLINFFSTSAPFISQGSNLIGVSDGNQGFTSGVNGDQVGSLTTPLDPLLTPLGFFGGDGLALVHALNIGSPARDAGNDGGRSTDQRGMGFDRVINGQADVGAFEVQIPTIVTQNVPGTPVAGQPFTIIGTVTDPRFPPTGSVEFFVDGNSVGTGTLDSSGNATIQATVVNAGNFMVSIVYSGDAAYIPASSQASTFTAIANTTTTVSAAPDPSIVTQPVTFVSIVTSGSPGTPSGTVQFFVDGSAFGQPVTLDMTGTATITAPNGFPVGPHQLASTYSGDANFAGSSASPVIFTVNRAPTATIVNVAPNPVFATDPIFLSATVTPSVSVTPTGSIIFVVDGQAIGSAAVDVNGQASLVLPDGFDIGDGTYDVLASYSGDPQLLGSDSPITVLNVIPVPTRTILTPVPSSAPFGTAIQLTANVAFNLPPLGAQRAGVNPAILNGVVNFFNGTTPLGTAPINNGVATIIVSNFPVGTNAINAVFVPATPNLSGSNGTAAVTITPLSVTREIFAVSSGFGIVTTVVVYDPNGVEITRFQPYGPDYMCGAVVATGDVTGDGIEDIVTAPTISGGPHVKIFDGVTFNQIGEFFAYDPLFRGGVNVAAGDLDGDGIAEIITGAGQGGGPLVNIYSFDATTGIRLRNSFFAYDPNLRSGITVAVSGGLLATGPGFTGGPHVKVFSGIDANLVASYFAFDPNSRNGVNVALSFDGNSIVLTAGTDAGRQPIVSTFDALSGQPLDTQMIYEPSFFGGVTVTNVRTLQGESRTVFGTGLGGGPRVRIFGPGDVSIADFFAFGPDFRGGVYVG